MKKFNVHFLVENQDPETHYADEYPETDGTSYFFYKEDEKSVVLIPVAIVMKIEETTLGFSQ